MTVSWLLLVGSVVISSVNLLLLARYDSVHVRFVISAGDYL